MADYLPIIKKNPRPYLQPLIDDIKARRDKTFFWPTGTQVYCGRQGSGKTISAVNDINRIKTRYPKAILVSNLQLMNLKSITVNSKDQLLRVLDSPKFDPSKHYLFFETFDQLSFLLTSVNNGFLGVVYLIDEIHTYFNALDSKNIPMFIFTEISQQRKQRKCIIGTSQLFMRMAKPFREQCDNIIMCSSVFKILTIQSVYDGMSVEMDFDGKIIGKRKKLGFFFHNRFIRNSFDTYQKVISANEQYDQLIRPVPIAK